MTDKAKTDSVTVNGINWTVGDDCVWRPPKTMGSGLASLTPKPSRASCLLGMHGDPWACDLGRMRGYLNTLIVDMSPEEAEKRTGPLRFDSYGEDGGYLTAEKREQYMAAAAKTGRTRKTIAVLPLHGPITQRASAFSAFFGGTSTEKFAAVFDALVATDSIGAIVIDVDSPGGVVYGVPELAEKVFKARGTKPIVAVANAEMLSGAYLIGSQADEVVVSPSGKTGSIGVWSLHLDYSGLMEKDGVTPTFISAGEKKVWGNPFEPLGDDAQAMLQAEVSEYYDQFISAVSRGRGATSKQVRDGFGQGASATAKDSVVLGLADRVATIEQVLKRLGGNLAEREQIRAEAAQREIELTELEAALEEAP